MYVCMYVCMYVRIYVQCMHVLYVCMYVQYIIIEHTVHTVQYSTVQYSTYYYYIAYCNGDLHCGNHRRNGWAIRVVHRRRGAVENTELHMAILRRKIHPPSQLH